LVSISYTSKGLKEFSKYKDRFLEIVGSTALASLKRADRVYNSGMDRMTKPNYFRRMHNYQELVDGNELNVSQIDNIVLEFAKKPKHSLLTFSIFRPADLLKKKRPGYVPCPIAGDFKFRKNELHLNVFFRSNDALNFLYPDIHYLRVLQKRVLDQAKMLSNNDKLKRAKLGKLNLYFSRIYLPLRMEMVKKQYINGREMRHKIESLTNDLEKVLNRNENEK
jgi:hypothetical protein